MIANLMKRAEQGRQRYAALVLLPTLLSLLYLGLLAADGYVSRAQVMVEQESQLGSAEIPVLSLLSVGGGSSKTDALVVQNFMRSRSMLEALDEELDLRGHFSGDGVDWFSRLPADASMEDFLQYFRDHLDLVVDDESLILSIEFVAFDRAFAQRVVQALVARAEAFVNSISQQLAREKLAFIESEVQRASRRLQESSQAIVQLQRRTDVFSAEKETEAVGEILAGLEVELAKQRTQLKILGGYLNPVAPDVIAARQRVDALERQVQQERERLIGAGSEGLNMLMLEYKEAEVNLRLASEMYATALAAMETTRLESARKVKYLVSVDSPSLADSAEHPRVAYWTFTIFIFLNLAYFVLGLIVAAVQDHKE